MGYVELCVRREGRFLRWCARKRLHQQFRSDPSFRTMFMDEARLAGLVRHPNAVGVLDVGEDEDGPFLMMDFVEGVPLSRLIAEAAEVGRSVPMQVAVRICADAARGLHAAHEVRSENGVLLGLVHRDISPQNILVGFDGTVRVTDFGIAKALGNVSRTSAGVLKGNMGYLSPEQLRFEEADRRSDFFSLGVTLYELLSGCRLYTNKDGFEGTRRILTEPPPDIGEVRSDVPPELCELLFELLAKKRESRPATASEIDGRLEGILAALIAEEGSITISDYMSQHFDRAMREQRATLAAYLRKLEALPAPLGFAEGLRSIDPGASAEPVALTPARRRARGRVWLPATLGAALAAVAGLVVGTQARWPTSTAAPGLARATATVAAVSAEPSAPEPPRTESLAAMTTPDTSRIPLVPPADRRALIPAPRVASTRGKVAHHTARGARHANRSSATSPNDTNHLVVPLFTEWR
jgi:serine/threonine-protein kinase